MMGANPRSNMAYLQGPLERNEFSAGIESGTVTITRCDRRFMISVIGKQCLVMQMGRNEASYPSRP